jgi:putative transposase
MAKWPVRVGADYLDWLNKPQTAGEEHAMKECIRRGRPYGSEAWTKQTAAKLGLESSLRARGRPREGPTMVKKDS